MNENLSNSLDLFRFDPVRTETTLDFIKKSELGRIIRKSSFSKKRINAFEQVVAETVAVSSSLLMLDPERIDFGAGSGISSFGKPNMAMTEAFQNGDGRIVFSTSYLNAHLNDQRGNMDFHIQSYQFVHPASVTAHEMRHIRQRKDNLRQVIADLALASDGRIKWQDTISEKEAASFENYYMDLVIKYAINDKRRGNLYGIFLPQFSPDFGRI